MIVAIVNGIALKEGDKVKTFRGEEVTFIECDQNGKNRVYCIDPEGYSNEWFSSVINADLQQED